LPRRREKVSSALLGERTGDGWISRRVAVNGVISVAWQQISCGKHRAGRRVDVHVDGPTLQIWDGEELKTLHSEPAHRDIHPEDQTSSPSLEDDVSGVKT
jgi:hypothetical protein